MADKGFWDNDWMQIQRRYWERWSELARSNSAAGEADTSPWESALEHWWQAVEPSAPPQAQEYVQKMMEQGRHFFRIAEQFSSAGEQKPDADMQSVWQQTLEAMKAAFAGDASNQAAQRLMAFWEMPLDNWQRMVSSMAPVPGDLLRNMPHGAAGQADPTEQLQRFLSAPGLGYSREEQQQYQSLSSRVLEYQQALADYNRFFSDLGVAAVDRLQQRFEQVAEQGQKIESAKALYDLWVGAFEEVYGEQVMTPEYAALHGRLINALVAVKRQAGVMVDENLGTLNMPTRRELRTLQGRLQEERREVKALKAEMAELKRMLSEQGEAKPVARKKAVSKKKAPVKKRSARKAQPGKKQSTAAGSKAGSSVRK